MKAPSPVGSWRRFCTELADFEGLAGSALGSDGPVGEESELLLTNLVQGWHMLFATDVSTPRWVPWNNVAIRNAANNPDATYAYCPVDAGGTYRIRGRRGTTRYAEILVATGLAPIFGGGDAPFRGAVVGHIDLDEVTDDGRFELTLSQTPPTGVGRVWRELPPEADHLLLRQMAYDWESERDASATIERLDPQAPDDRLSTADRLEMLANYVSGYAEVWLTASSRLAESGPANQLHGSVLPSVSQLRQAYCQGVFEFGTDEALLLEVPVPYGTRYWGFHLADEMLVPIDWGRHQSSLNGGTAFVGQDGVLRAVVAASDPGVDNWLDSAGVHRGVVYGRWIGGDEPAVPATRLVPLSRLADELPTSFPRVDPAQRRVVSAARERGAQRRW